MKRSHMSAEENESLRDYVKAHVVPRFDNQTALAKELGVDQSTLSGFLGARSGSTLAVRAKVADIAARLGLPAPPAAPPLVRSALTPRPATACGPREAFVAIALDEGANAADVTALRALTPPEGQVGQSFEYWHGAYVGLRRARLALRKAMRELDAEERKP